MGGGSSDGPLPTQAERFLDELDCTQQGNVARGREKFGVPKGFDDSKASYHEAQVREEYKLPKKATVMGSLECKGFDEKRTNIKDFSLCLGTHFLMEGGFPIENYEKTLTSLIGEKYRLAGISGDSDKTWNGGKHPGYIEKETNRLKFAPKTDPKNNEFYISMETEYRLKDDNRTRGKVKSQNLFLMSIAGGGWSTWTPVSDVKYAMNAVYKAVGLNK